jgi:hypothetical protein
MRPRGWILLLAGLLAGLAMSPSAEAFGGKRRGRISHYYYGAGGQWVPVVPAGSIHAPASAGYGSAPTYGYSGGGPPGSGYGGGYYGLQGYNNNALGSGTPGSGGFRIIWGAYRR